MNNGLNLPDRLLKYARGPFCSARTTVLPFQDDPDSQEFGARTGGTCAFTEAT
jgi:hypothetical protein